MARKFRIDSNLTKKGEVFRILALAESLNTPILLIGDPGTGKTAAVLDYADATSGQQGLGPKDVFILETDEGTKAAAVKGNINMAKLVDPLNPSFEKDAPITKAKFVVINEVDKASAGLRNSLLGIMNEKKLFDGGDITDCKWKAFVATCNKIPDDEIGSPFWDRFLITFKVNRLRQSEMLEYYAKGGKTATFPYNVTIPEQSELDAMVVPADKLKRTMDIVYDKLSDRSLSFIPTLAKHIAGVWGFNINRALVKAVELLISKDDANILAKALVSRELRAIYDKVDQIDQMSNYESYKNLLEDIDKLGEKLKISGKITPEDEEDLINQVNEKSDRLDFLKSEDESMNALAGQLGVE